MIKLPEFMTMIMMLLMFIIMLNFMMGSSHPIFMVILLVMYSIMICVIMSEWSQNFIYSIMIFLIMISGLLIMFLYFSSLVSNDQNKFNFMPIMTINFLMNLLITFYYTINYNNYIIYNFMENMQINHLNMNLFNNIMYMYSYPFNNLTLICMFYLLITLFMIIKICSFKSSSLRKLK